MGASQPAHYFAAIQAVLPGADERAIELLGRYLQLVDSYASALDLTAYQGPSELAPEYVFAPSRLRGLATLNPEGEAVDLGSGAGCPVVALAVLMPGWRFHAVESRERRASFLATVQARLGLANLVVLNERTETLAAREARRFDMVTARAYGTPALLRQHAAALLRSGGELRGFAAPSHRGEAETWAASGFMPPAFLEISLDARHWVLLRAQRL